MIMKMKFLIKKWHSYVKNMADEDSIFLKTRKNLINYVKNNPEVNKTINLDKPKGSKKNFSGKSPRILPFDYGEWPKLINPSDNMGWDLIIVPSSNKDDENLTPVGHIEYKDQKNSVLGNDKVILAPNSSYSDKDKQIIIDFFNTMDQFEVVEWY